MWYNVTDLTAYFTLMAGVLPFWTMRFATRGKEGAIKTGILANLTIAGIAALFYLLLIPFITSRAWHRSSIPWGIFCRCNLDNRDLLRQHDRSKSASKDATSDRIWTYCAANWQSHTGLRFDHQFTSTASWSRSRKFGTHMLLKYSTILNFLSEELKQRFRREYVTEWLKGSLANIYNVVGSQLASLVFIMLFIYGGENGRGELGAGATIVNVITYSSFLAYALYPKLLAERKSEHITTALKMVLMFAIPLTIGAIALSDSYIRILTDKYTDAGPILIVLAMDSFVAVISSFFTAVLYGVENVDEGSRLSLRQLVRSRLFLAFSLPYIQSMITLPTAFYLLSNYARNQAFQAALYVSVVNAVARFAMFLILYAIVRKMIKIQIPWKTIAKYVLAAAAMGAILYIIPHPTRTLTILAETAVGGLIYILIIMAIDKEARTLPKFILKELRAR